MRQLVLLAAGGRLFHGKHSFLAWQLNQSDVANVEEPETKSGRFTGALFGIPGDEDGGGMTAFGEFPMMGFYPVTRGVPIYVLGSPVFDRVNIRLNHGETFKIVARNNSAENKYIPSIKLNGQPLDQVWFRHAGIVNGGALELEMGNIPTRSLGSSPESFPPCSDEVNPQNLTSLVAN